MLTVRLGDGAPGVTRPRGRLDRPVGHLGRQGQGGPERTAEAGCSCIFSDDVGGLRAFLGQARIHHPTLSRPRWTTPIPLLAFGMGSSQSSPLGGGGEGRAFEIECANGIIRNGSRVQTQYTRAEGGDDRWYAGTIVEVYANHKAKIRYDDGDKWTGDTMHIYLLNPPPTMAAPQQTPGMVVMTAVVPAGAGPGQQIPVMGPNGQQFHVAVPPGVHPGQSFQFQAPRCQEPVAVAVPVQAQGAPTVVYGQPVIAQPVQGTRF